MIELLQILFIGHAHKWKTIESYPLFENDSTGTRPIGKGVISQCEICGKPKQFKLTF